MNTSETELAYRTKGNSSPQDKPRVYFTCHPADFERCFDKICEDIFKTHDCVIFYKKDMSKNLSENTREVDLGRMNLFVMPITFKLLTQPSPAMDTDFEFADEKHYPILPIMLESGIDEFYERKFGERQYLNPYSMDLTEIKYEDKLKKYLESVLISKEMMERVRKAFDAYIFLSYRKKDRRYANELMKLIHKDPVCRNFAIWFDEFLIPGESFKVSIEKALEQSKLFMLLVTPSLYENDNQGNPNFVQRVEFPMARDSGKKLLPVEKVQTDEQTLRQAYQGLPEIVSADNEGEVCKAVLRNLESVSHTESDDPEHNFLLGLAYLDGIDVEINIDYGLQLLTKAGEAGLIEAMKKLYNIYSEGQRIPVNYPYALKWAQKIYDSNCEKYGENHEDTLEALNQLALTYGKSGEFKKALELSEKYYELRCRISGEEHFNTLIALNNLSVVYNSLGEYKKALELSEKCYELRCRISGEEHFNTLNALNNLSLAYNNLGEYKKAIELSEKCYTLQCRVLGEEHPDALNSLNSLATYCCNSGEYQEALELNEKCYKLRNKILGEEHPDTLNTICNLAANYNYLGEYKKGLKLNEKCYQLCCNVLGEEHPKTLNILNNIALNYCELGEYEKALELQEKCYKIRCKILSEEHPDTLNALNNIAYIYDKSGQNEKSIELQEKCYIIQCRTLGENHPKTLNSLNNLALQYHKSGQKEKAIQLQEKCYLIKCRTLGEEHPETLRSMNNLVYHYNDNEKYKYSDLKKYKKSYKLSEKCYTLSCAVLGSEHPYTIIIMNNYAMSCYYLCKLKKANVLIKHSYELSCKVLGKTHPETLKRQSALESIKNGTKKSIILIVLAIILIILDILFYFFVF